MVKITMKLFQIQQNPRLENWKSLYAIARNSQDRQMKKIQKWPMKVGNIVVWKIKSTKKQTEETTKRQRIVMWNQILFLCLCESMYTLSMFFQWYGLLTGATVSKGQRSLTLSAGRSLACVESEVDGNEAIRQETWEIVPPKCPRNVGLGWKTNTYGNHIFATGTS